MSAVKARLEPSLEARVVARTALRYANGADASEDRPAHVRAGSALARLGPQTLAVVQDDASFVALVEGPAFAVRAVPLPATDGVRLFDETRFVSKKTDKAGYAPACSNVQSPHFTLGSS